MSRAAAFFGRPVRIPVVALVLLSFSAMFGNFAQWVERDDLRDSIRAQAAGINAEAECRARIAGYVEGLSITQDIALGTGILDRLGPNDDDAFDAAVRTYADAVRQLAAAKSYRDKSVEICDHNPRFDPTKDIPSPAVGTDGG